MNELGWHMSIQTEQTCKGTSLESLKQTYKL